MQLEQWEAEYGELNNIPSSKTMNPSKALKTFLETYDGPKDSVLDIGSGKGRNSIYLAEQGFKSVIGLEIVQRAIDDAKKSVREKSLSEKIDFYNLSAGVATHFEDESFDLIVDMMVLHLLNKQEREVYSNEVARLLKPGGQFLFYTLYADSPASQALCSEFPGEEPNSYIIQETLMVEKAFNEDDMLDLFSPLRLVKMETVSSFTPAFGDVYERVYLTGVFER